MKGASTLIARLQAGLGSSLLGLSEAAQVTALDWADLHGWADDDHAKALSVFMETCGDLKDGDWPAICALAAKQGDPRTYFETFFRPVLITDGCVLVLCLLIPALVLWLPNLVVQSVFG